LQNIFLASIWRFDFWLPFYGRHGYYQEHSGGNNKIGKEITKAVIIHPVFDHQR